MSWKHKEPCRDNYDTEEEYEDALNAYESALDDYVDRKQEEYYERKYRN